MAAIEFLWKGARCAVWFRGKGAWTVTVQRPDGSEFIGRAVSRKDAVIRARQVATTATERPPVRRVRPDGYVVIGRRFEHRIVLAAKLGRKLKRGEDAHHLNGDRSDNRPENLEPVLHGEHVAGHNRRRNLAMLTRFRVDKHNPKTNPVYAPSVSGGVR